MIPPKKGSFKKLSWARQIDLVVYPMSEKACPFDENAAKK